MNVLRAVLYAVIIVLLIIGLSKLTGEGFEGVAVQLLIGIVAGILAREHAKEDGK